MNVDNGRIYEGMLEIAEAQSRGEALTGITQYEKDILSAMKLSDRPSALAGLRQRPGSKLTAATCPIDSAFPVLGSE